MDVQEWDDQHEHTYSNYVRTQDVTLKTCRRRWMIGRNGERGSRISALPARHDDDDDDYNQINRQRDRIIWMRDVLTQFLCFLFLFSFSLYCFCSWSILVSCFLFFSFFFFFFSSSALPSSFLFFFFSHQSVHLFVACLILFFFFLLLSIPAFFFVLFVDVVLWCLKLSFTVTRFVLSPWTTLLAQVPN